MVKRLITYLLLFATLAAGLPVAYAATGPGDIQGETYAVMEVKTGQVLLEKAGDQKRAPASITKILTCALALEKGGLDQKVTMERDTVYSIPANTTHIALEEGETLAVRDLLYSTILLSANDAANGLAQYTGGSLDVFTGMMNRQVAELGLKNTHFNNAHGLDDPNHYTTARDMAAITRWALGVEGFRDLFGTLEYEMPETNKKKRDYDFINQDAMLHDVNKVYYEGVEGGKLGYTDDAKHTIVTLAKRGDLELICVVLGSGLNTKYSDSAALLDYCFSQFDVLTLPAGNIKDFVVPLSNGADRIGNLDIHAAQDVSLIVEKGTTLRDLRYEYKVKDYYTEGEDIQPTLELYDRHGTYMTTVSLAHTVVEAAQMPMSQVVRDQNRAKAQSGLATAAKWVGLFLLIVVALLFIVRFFVRLYYRRRQRRRRQAIRLHSRQAQQQRQRRQRIVGQ